MRSVVEDAAASGSVIPSHQVTPCPMASSIGSPSARGLWMISEREAAFLHRAVLAGEFTMDAADSFRRFTPASRELFDEFLDRLIAYPVGDGTWDMVSSYFVSYSHRLFPPAQPPALIPDRVVHVLKSFAQQYRGRRAGEFVIDGHSLTVGHQCHVLERLVFQLGGCDELLRAGLNLHSKLASARIRDGFVHPGIGVQTWAEVASFTPDSWEGPEIEAIHEAAKLAERWVEDSQRRDQWELAIQSLALTVSW